MCYNIIHNPLFFPANIAGALAGVIFFTFYLPDYYVKTNYHEMSKVEKLTTGLLFNTGMALGARIIGLYEGTGEGAQWSNFTKPATVDDNISLLDVIFLLLFDCGCHVLITWYLDSVYPGEYGIPKPYNFCFKVS